LANKPKYAGNVSGRDLGLIAHRLLAPQDRERHALLLKEPRGHGGRPGPLVLRQRKIAMLESHFRAIARQQFLIEHHPEIGAVRALQVFIDDHAHRAVGLAFHQMNLSHCRRRR
jgi:hypothetical protein